MSSLPGTSEADKSQVQIQFFTKQPQYSVPDIPYAVPSAISIEELNSLINQLIKESDVEDTLKRSVEFDFLSAGEFIRTSLGEHIFGHGISTEAVIPIEYVERLPAPQPQDCLLHDDWVSAVQCSDRWILTGCYDNTLHLWTLKGNHLMTIPGHTGAVKAVSWVSSKDDVTTFVSASRDQTLLLWNWNTDENTVECVKTCKGHAEAVECVGVSEDKQKFASGGWDNMLKIWSTCMDEEEEWDSNDDEEESEAKKIKKDRKSQIKVPKVTLKGHKEAITAICWMNSNDLVTSSMDHTLRLWNTEMSTTVQELAGNKSFFDVHVSPISKLLITASSDKFVRLYDSRSSEGAICKQTFTSHQAWVTTVRWSTTNGNLFISGSYDHQVKLWDTRSPKAPMFDLTGHDDNVLCSDWTEPSIIVSGGSDNTLRIFRASSAKTKNKDDEDS